MHFTGGQGSTIHPESVHDPDAAAHTLLCDDGNTGLVQRFNIPVDCTAGYFKTFCQFRRGDLLLVQENREDCDQTVKFHVRHLKQDIIMTCLLYHTVSSLTKRT